MWVKLGVSPPAFLTAKSWPALSWALKDMFSGLVGHGIGHAVCVWFVCFSFSFFVCFSVFALHSLSCLLLLFQFLSVFSLSFVHSLSFCLCCLSLSHTTR